MRAPLKTPPAIRGRLTEKLLPDWARRVAAVGTPQLTPIQLARLIDKARTWPLLVWGTEYSTLFARVVAAAQRAWTRRGRTTDHALRVVYELDILMPALRREAFVLQIPELRWFVEARAALRHRKGLKKRIDKMLPRRRGAPEKRRSVAALFGALRGVGYSYEHARDATAEATGRHPKAVEDAVRRHKASELAEDFVAPEEESDVKPCTCLREYPYCESCNLWFSAKAKWKRKQFGLNPRTGKPFHVCARDPKLRRVEQTALICKDHAKCNLVQRRRGEGFVLICPACQKDGAEVGKRVARPLPHRHCATCGRPHPVNGPPILRPVGMTAWACNDNPSDRDGCLAHTRRALLSCTRVKRAGPRLARSRLREGR